MQGTGNGAFYVGRWVAVKKVLFIDNIIGWEGIRWWRFCVLREWCMVLVGCEFDQDGEWYLG